MSVEQETEPDVVAGTQEILASAETETTSLITVLQRIQNRFGYLPREAMLEVAGARGIPRAHVYGVASFYNQFRFVPPGKYPVKMCMGTACHIKGGEAILSVWEKKLGIQEGEVTADRLYSLDRVACVGCCAIAPVSLVGDRVYGSMQPTKVDGILMATQREEEAVAQGEEDEPD